MSWLRSAKTFWISGSLMVIVQLAILSRLNRLDSLLNHLRLQTTFSPDEFQQRLSQWGPDGIRIFISHYQFDFFYPFIYGTFLASCLTLSGAVNIFGKRWLLLPVLAVALDLTENLAHLQIAMGRSEVASSTFFIGATAASLKWVAIVLTILLVAAGATLDRRQTRQRNTAGR